MFTLNELFSVDELVWCPLTFDFNSKSLERNKARNTGAEAIKMCIYFAQVFSSYSDLFSFDRVYVSLKKKMNAKKGEETSETFPTFT